MDDVMYIKDLRVQTIIGLYDWERKVRQEVSIDIDIFFDNKFLLFEKTPSEIIR